MLQIDVTKFVNRIYVVKAKERVHVEFVETSLDILMVLSNKNSCIEGCAIFRNIGWLDIFIVMQVQFSEQTFSEFSLKEAPFKEQ